MKAIAIILAAGQSSRMGKPKALLETAPGVTFLDRLAGIFRAAGLSPLAVLGAHAEQIVRLHPQVKQVLNAGWVDGQLSSVRVGLRAALLQGATRILIHPVDIPLIAEATAVRLLSALEDCPAGVATFEGKSGHPLGLRATAARLLLGSRLDTLEEGVALLEARQVAVEDPRILDNLNSPEAYLQRFGHLP